MARFRTLAIAALSAILSAGASDAEDANASLFWGTYRPNLYFGMRPRVPNTLMTGMMWHGLNDYQSLMSATSSIPTLCLF